jgi:hypothetical protein
MSRLQVVVGTGFRLFAIRAVFDPELWELLQCGSFSAEPDGVLGPARLHGRLNVSAIFFGKITLASHTVPLSGNR